MKMRALILFLSGVLALNEMQAQGFEEPAYHAGQSLGGKDGWQAAQDAVISAEQAAEGTQSVKIEGGLRIQKTLSTVSGAQFIDFWILPTFTEEKIAAIDLGGAKLGFLKKNGEGKVLAYTGPADAEKIVECGSFPLVDNLAGMAETWLRITVRKNQKTWDLFLNGRPAVMDLPLEVSNSAVLSFQAPQAGETYLDSLMTGAENPIFPDKDFDGMPDPFEIAHGLNPWINDRDSDFDGDGVSNIQEFSKGSAPSVASGGDVQRNTWYIDNINGSDANSGLLSYPVAGDGPKRSFQAAVVQAGQGDVIVFLPTDKPFEASFQGVARKNLILRAAGKVTIK